LRCRAGLCWTATLEEYSGDASYRRHADAEPNDEVAELLRQNGRQETHYGEWVAQVIAIREATP